MPHDEGLAQRIRETLSDAPDLSEKRMFGGVCFMLGGHMALGVTRDTLMVRVGAQGEAAALQRPGARPMDFTGRPLKGFVFVAPDGVAEDAALAHWVQTASSFVRGLPPKDPGASGAAKGPARARPRGRARRGSSA